MRKLSGWILSEALTGWILAPPDSAWVNSKIDWVDFLPPRIISEALPRWILKPRLKKEPFGFYCDRFRLRPRSPDSRSRSQRRFLAVSDAEVDHITTFSSVPRAELYQWRSASANSGCSALLHARARRLASFGCVILHLTRRCVLVLQVSTRPAQSQVLELGVSTTRTIASNLVLTRL